jgi:hypothetical protein
LTLPFLLFTDAARGEGDGDNEDNDEAREREGDGCLMCKSRNDSIAAFATDIGGGEGLLNSLESRSSAD